MKNSSIRCSPEFIASPSSINDLLSPRISGISGHSPPQPPFSPSAIHPSHPTAFPDTSPPRGRDHILEDLARILDYTNETLIIIEGYRGRLHPVLVRTFILDNFGRVEEFARAYAQHVGASTMRTLCDELKDLLEE